MSLSWMLRLSRILRRSCPVLFQFRLVPFDVFADCGCFVVVGHGQGVLKAGAPSIKATQRAFFAAQTKYAKN